MKQIISAFLIAGAVTGAMLPCSAADGDIKVSVNGDYLTFDVPPQIINDRTMVPLRAIFESIGADVQWNEETKTVVSTKDDITVSLQIGNSVMYVNGKEVVLDSPACVVNDRTLVPARAVSEAYGLNVEWDNDTRTVFISSNTEDNENDIENTEDNDDTSKDYDDVSMNINQIKYFIDSGMYSEAIKACEDVEAKFNLSPDDSIVIKSLRKTAESVGEVLSDKNNIEKEYYPDSELLTYTCATGFEPVGYQNIDEDVAVYSYKFDEDALLKYMTYLIYEEWEVVAIENNAEEFSLTYYMKKDNMEAGLSIQLSYDEVWIAYIKNNE